MRLPTKARSKSLLTTVLAGALLAGCAGESTAPAVKSATAKQSRTSPFIPSAAAKALVGVADGRYEFTVDPSRDQSVNLGPNYLSIPANAICDIATSSYGPAHWNESCVPQADSVRITAVVRNSTSDHPSIDFYPAMRFAPTTNVGLYVYVPTGMAAFQKNWIMKYCNDVGVCVDESLADSDLRSFADTQNHMVFRRIKHFSGYLVSIGFLEDLAGLL
ncbi:MAG: hypothetical protein JWN79_2718 [Gemmatimonadetes bacterium]|jgi:hypothetical protein|nr:hypothetical protein [Gemmatimonadota bacterium]